MAKYPDYVIRQINENVDAHGAFFPLVFNQVAGPSLKLAPPNYILDDNKENIVYNLTINKK